MTLEEGWSPIKNGRIAAMVVLTGLAGALNYAANLVFSRVLGRESFGDLTALIAVVVVVGVPTAAAQTVVASKVAAATAAGDKDRVRYLVRYALFHIGLLGAGAAACYAVASPLLSRLLHLQSAESALALTPLLFFAFLVPVVLGVFQGLQRYLAFGVVTVALAASRLTAGGFFARLADTPGALLGHALGNAIVLAAAGAALGTWWWHRGAGAARAGLRRKPDPASLWAGGAFVAFALLSNADILLAKVFLNAGDAGLYAALATVAKILIFLPGAVAVVVVPRVAGVSVRERVRVLRYGALAVAGASILAGVPIAALPKLTLRLMFGRGYVDAAPGVLPIVIAGAGLALLNLVMVYSVAIGDRRWVVLPLCGVAAQILGICLFHGSPAQIAWVQAAVAVALVLANEAKFLSATRIFTGTASLDRLEKGSSRGVG